MILFICLIFGCLVTNVCADDRPFKVGQGAVFTDRIEVLGIGAPTDSLIGKPLAIDAANMVAMIDALRNFGEILYEMQKYINEYEKGKSIKDIENRYKKGNSKSSNNEFQKAKEDASYKYKLFLRYKDLFTKYPTTVVKHDNANNICYDVNINIGKFIISAETRIKDAKVESDIINVQLPDRVIIKVKDFILASDYFLTLYDKFRSLYKEAGLEEEGFKNLSDGTSEFRLTCKQSIPIKAPQMKETNNEYSYVSVTITGYACSDISKGIVEDEKNNRWYLPDKVIIPVREGICSSGTRQTREKSSLTVTAIAEKPGAIKAKAGTVNIISTPTAGWLGVTNKKDAIPGVPIVEQCQRIC